jgi:CDP-6-deoxy-D-xylo-4-hexulose-3-dehydrase
MNPEALALRAQILALVEQYTIAAFPEPTFVPGETSIPPSGKVFDGNEVRQLVDSSLDFWLTTGRFAGRFEADFARWCGVRHALLCNSGSSANLLALSCLTSPELEEKHLQPGDEVITVAAGFPTTVNPIFQNGLVPVFVDVLLPSCDIDITQLEAALSPKTRAVMLAHTLGVPFNLSAVSAFCRQHDLFLIEDSCDALGAKWHGRKVGTWGDTATVSFYPAHHMTMGEGGCVLTNRPKLKKIIESFRDWGRDCWCAPGEENTCGTRYDWQLGELPHGYDHKYIYSHVGYNLKLTDMQAAVGCAQMEKLDGFIEQRRRNFERLKYALTAAEEWLMLPGPVDGHEIKTEEGRSVPEYEASPFGFLLMVRPDAPFSRNELIHFLDDRHIGTRLLFGGNLTRQPLYKGLNYRIAAELTNSDLIMHGAFWIGVYPGLNDAMLDYASQSIIEFCQARVR